MTDATENTDTQPAEPDLTGRQLGDYRILRRLGRGAMAEVYLAEQMSLRRQVAFKVLKASRSQDETAVKRFHHEAQAMASVVHANIVQTHEVGCIDGIHFIAQEYVKGQNLRQVITRSGPLDTALAVAILRQAAAALHKSGQQGIVHRDVKPENILISAEGEAKVADFGLARVSGPDEGVNLTQVGVTMGTPLYMSPEQVEGRKLDPRSDLYSLGVTCYHMLAGRPPFEAEAALQVAVKHLHSAPQPLIDLRPDLPEGLCGIVHQMLAKDPDNRYQQAADILADLKQLAIESPDEAWAASLADLSVPELGAVAHSRLEDTQRLDVCMKTIAGAATSPRRIARVASLIGLATLAAFVAGAAAAWAVRQPYLLSADPNAPQPVVERREDVVAQFYYAVLVNTEAAWKSVERYFPPDESQQNRYYAHRAKQELARFYLEQNRWTEAQPLLADLANLDPAERQFRAFGLAGQAIVLWRQGNKDEAEKKLADALSLRDQLDDQMRAEVDRLSRQIRGESRPGPAGG